MSTYHHLLHKTYTRWSDLEQAIEPIVSTEEKGEVFEQFVYLYLTLRKDYYQIDKLYRAKDIPAALREKLQLELTDYGVDGVFILTDGTIAAYQAKFRSNRGTATVRELATFWAEAAQADHKFVIANAATLPTPAGKHGSSILADTFDALDADFLAALQVLATTTKQPVLVKATPDAHQTRMIEKTVQGFKAHDRGKLIAACGAGKTLTSLWIIEQLEATTVLILVPSLALIKQTLEAWATHKNQQFSYLCVCSDQSVVDAKELDYGEYEVSEVDFPVTTDPAVVQKFLQSSAQRKYVFSTYQSTSAVAEAAHDSTFDLVIFDEAHRTAGQKDGSVYSLALNDEHITAKKRLFMTATERLVQPWIIDRAAEEDRVVFSMDDTAVYGELFDRYTFGEAIQDGVIADYKILLTAVTASEVEGLIQDNRLLVAEGDTDERLLTAENIYKQVVLQKAMKQYGITKAITFHSSVKRAKAFVNGSGNESLRLDDLYPTIWPEIGDRERYFDYVDGSMPAGLRKQKLREFERSQLGILSNARCLTEGIDVPVIDSVYFVDPKTSLVDIVQACGRALRKSRTDTTPKTAYFIVPIILGDDDTAEALEQSKFETLLKLVQALRGQDERMADWIETINLGHVKGRGGGGRSSDSP
ncbi:MAG: DEAD/DEAH box helicase family protein, partial [Candidatus Saccharimonadales bacterium]